MPTPLLVTETGLSQRKSRFPAHKWQIRQQPWQIQPFMIAPVLPGETMDRLVMQARVVSDPILNPLIGWWCEYYIFYVKHRDLADRDKFTEMMLDPNADLSTLDSATKVEHYHVNGVDSPAIDWVDLCLDRVVEEYFRYEGETVATASIGNLPAAKVSDDLWIDSAVNSDDFVDPSSLDTDLTDVGGPGGAKVLASEIDAATRDYYLARMLKTTDMTYEDFLRSYGVNLPESEEVHKPELLRYVRDWSYPTNTIDPADGSPTSAVSWVVQESADKPRFFREPGFIFGVCVVRPKVYLKGLTSSAVLLMRDARTWLPAVLSDDPWSSMVKVTAGDPPLDNNTDDYWVDVKDLFLYGDQFVNFALTETDANLIDLPTAALNKRYPTAADADSLFVTPLTQNLIRQDGIASIMIKTRLTDTSPTLVGART